MNSHSFFFILQNKDLFQGESPVYKGSWLEMYFEEKYMIAFLFFEFIQLFSEFMLVSVQTKNMIANLTMMESHYGNHGHSHGNGNHGHSHGNHGHSHGNQNQGNHGHSHGNQNQGNHGHSHGNHGSRNTRNPFDRGTLKNIIDFFTSPTDWKRKFDSGSNDQSLL